MKKDSKFYIYNINKDGRKYQSISAHALFAQTYYLYFLRSALLIAATMDSQH